MRQAKKLFKTAFPLTIPVLAGYIFLGIAYGILMTSHGFSILLTVGMSVLVFAGSMQFVAVEVLTAQFNPLGAFMIALTVNARHIFYGISMLDMYRGMGAAKPFLIFAMTDETFSVLCGAKLPADVSRKKVYTLVSFLDYSYWIIGSAIGAVAGNVITFNTEGIDFALTALFVVIFINQWKEAKDHTSALIGLICTALCLIIFRESGFLIPSMIAITIALAVYRPFCMKKEGKHD